MQRANLCWTWSWRCFRLRVDLWSLLIGFAVIPVSTIQTVIVIRLLNVHLHIHWRNKPKEPLF